MARRLPNPARRRALELLAASNDGATEAIMAAHGFTVEQLVELVRSGLASATPGARGRGQARDPDDARADHRGGAAGAGNGAPMKFWEFPFGVKVEAPDSAMRTLEKFATDAAGS